MDVATSTKTLGTVTTLGFQLAPGETANGIDDNGDGRVDEGVVTYTYTPASGGPVTVQIGGNVTGLRFNSSGTGMGMLIAVDIGMSNRKGNLMQKTFTQEVTFRN